MSLLNVIIVFMSHLYNLF